MRYAAGLGHTITPILADLLADAIPVAEDLSDDAVYIVDGTLLPCWSWRDHPELYSGKHKTTGYNVQVAATLAGTLAWVSDPIPGSRHDTHALTESDVLEGLTKENWIGDKGYIGTGIHTPTRKPPSRSLTQTEKECNTTINKIRWIIEQVIANLKTWRILHTDYRRPLKTLATTITATLGLQFYRLAA